MILITGMIARHNMLDGRKWADWCKDVLDDIKTQAAGVRKIQVNSLLKRIETSPGIYKVIWPSHLNGEKN